MPLLRLAPLYRLSDVLFGSLKRFRCTLSPIHSDMVKEVEDRLTAEVFLKTEAQQQPRAITAGEQDLALLMRRYKDVRTHISKLNG
jgi:hypothetical protein